MNKAERDELTRMFENLRDRMVDDKDRAAVEQIAWAYWTGGFSEDGSYPTRRIIDERPSVSD